MDPYEVLPPVACPDHGYARRRVTRGDIGGGQFFLLPCLLLMMLDGKIDVDLDLIIFSDTFGEPWFVYTYLDRVTDNLETLIINRGKDTGVVIISLDEYNSLLATQHELSSKTNEERLDSAIEKLK